MDKRIIELESTFAYQDERIRKLELIVSQQQLEMHELREALDLLAKRLPAVKSVALRDPADEPPPPHY
ncbi:MAG TPA: SlyX family protein [Polyangiaceae bacterium]|mgnify:CR=1 FL=1|nr:SlyX family protein [Polyangiaceae bacterium]